MDAAIEFDGLEKTFPGMERPALDALTGRIRAGAITGVAGSDGAGKTTLIRLMAGLLKPDRGSIRVCGRDPVRESARLREEVGYMPQKFGLYEDLSVIENLTLHADLRGVVGDERERAFGRLLSFTDLKRFTTRMAGKLSGGMKQKLGLACALLGHPRVLLLDEPGVGVDPISRRELWAMVRELATDGIAVIWSTAYLDEAEDCDEVLLLNDGKLLFSGQPAELTRRLDSRTFHVRGTGAGRRKRLAWLLCQPAVADGVIQGRSLRIVLREGASRPDADGEVALESPQAEAQVPAQSSSPPQAQPPAPPSPKLEWVSVEPRFEDAFIDLLGGGPGGGSVLADQLAPRPPVAAELIVAHELTKTFGSFTATDHVSFAVRHGEIFGLLGPNGAGKSTTFKMMCGLLTPTSGEARILGLDLQRSPGEARQQIGYMAQKFSLYGQLTVRQNLNFFAGVYGIPRWRRRETVDRMIAVFHMEPLLNLVTDELTPGFKQRLALACALMHDPQILFLDEPTSGVDPLTRREFWNHINGLVDKGVTVMVTTHFMDEAEYCDRIGLVHRGRLIALDAPDALKAGVATPERPDPTMEDAFVELIRRDTEP